MPLMDGGVPPSLRSAPISILLLSSSRVNWCSSVTDLSPSPAFFFSFRFYLLFSFPISLRLYLFNGTMLCISYLMSYYVCSPLCLGPHPTFVVGDVHTHVWSDEPSSRNLSLVIFSSSLIMSLL